MARPKKVNESTEQVGEVSDVLKELDKMNPDAAFLDENALSQVTDWIDTGCYALNGIISGSIFKGVPVGRVSGFYGPQATGKTLIANKIVANAQKKGYTPIYFDSENALDDETALRLGCDIAKIKHAPIETIGACKAQIMRILTSLIDKNLKKKAILIIDSLANLQTQKEIDDALKDHEAADMGLRAKQLSSLMRSITFRAAKAEVPIIFTNHIYENPNEMYPSLIKKQSGGLKPLYIASLLVQLSISNEKSGESIGEVGALSSKISGGFIRALTAKNRFAPPFITTELYLNYKTGLSKYYGLLELAEGCGAIQKEGNTYSFEGQKLGYASSFQNDPSFWTEDVLNKVDVSIKKNFALSNTSDTLTTKEETIV